MPPGGFCRLLYGTSSRYSFTFREYRSHTPKGCPAGPCNKTTHEEDFGPETMPVAERQVNLAVFIGSPIA